MVGEHIDVVAALSRLVDDQARELVTLREENGKLLKAAVLGLLARGPASFGTASCRKCGAAFDKHSKHATLCRPCYRTSTTSHAADMRLKKMRLVGAA